MDTNESKGGCLVTAGQYFAWLVTSLGAILDALYIREAALAGLALFQQAQYQIYRSKGGLGLDLSTGFAMTLYDDVIMLILGCLAIAAVIAIEYYFRKGRPKGLLLKRIGIVVGIEVGIIILSILIRMTL